MGAELISFNKGLTSEARSCLIAQGYLRTVENIVFDVDGTQLLRPTFQAHNDSLLTPIHSIKMFRGSLFAGSGAKLFGDAGGLSGAFMELYAAFAEDPWFWDSYKNFLLGVNGTNDILVDEYTNVYDARIEAPATAPSGALGAAGNPNGHYMLYVSFLLTFQNGHTYETGISPASADVNATSDKIEWSNIPVCTYTALYGATPTIHRKLYRGPGTGGTLADIYYVDTIADNSTTTYSDDLTDAELVANGACYVDLYLPPPIAKYAVFHYGRCFMIPYVNSHRLWWTEAVTSLDAFENESLMPLAVLETNWDDIRVAGLTEVDPQGLVSWGVNLYIPLKHTWLRKQGNTVGSWSYKKTYARYGIGAPRTIATSSTPLGILGLTVAEFDKPNLTLFTGQESQVIGSPRLDDILHNDLDITKMDQCVGKLYGPYYHFLYPSVDGEMRYLALDLRRFPDIKAMFWTNLHGQTIDGDTQSSKFFVGGTSGQVLKRTGREEIDVVVETHDRVGGSLEWVNVHKTFRQLKYALVGTVSMQVYIDDVLMKWPDDSTEKVLTGTDETLQLVPSLPQDWGGYRIRIKLIGTGLTEFKLYSPWVIEFDRTE